MKTFLKSANELKYMTYFKITISKYFKPEFASSSKKGQDAENKKRTLLFPNIFDFQRYF